MSDNKTIEPIVSHHQGNEKVKLTKNQKTHMIAIFMILLGFVVMNIQKVIKTSAIPSMSDQFGLMLAIGVITLILSILFISFIYSLVVNFISIELNVSYGVHVYYYLIATIVLQVLNTVITPLISPTTHPVILNIVGGAITMLTVGTYCYMFVREKQLTKAEALKAGMIIVIGHFILTYGLGMFIS